MRPAPCFGNESRLERVSRYSVRIARELRLPEEDINRSRIAARSEEVFDSGLRALHCAAVFT